MFELFKVTRLLNFSPIAEILHRGTISEQERIAMIVEHTNNEGENLRQFLQANITRWLGSPKFRMIKDGRRYFENDNDINLRKRYVIGKDGEKHEAWWLSNQKLSHAYMRKLTKQKVGYVLSKPFTWESDDEVFQDLLSDYFTPQFMRMFKNCGQDAIIAGLGWIQVYYNEEGELKFKRLQAEEIIPFWEDSDHTTQDATLRVYEVEVYDGTELRLERNVEYFTKDAIYHFIQDKDGRLSANPIQPVSFNFTLQEGYTSVAESVETTTETVEANAMWEKIPLIPVKYNTEEDSLLHFIKSLVDDYDRRTSDLSNVLEDEPDKIKIVKDYDGTNPGEFQFNLARYRTAFLRGSGEMTALDTSISTDALENHLTRTHKDIFEFGGGVDTQNKDLGDTSGKALKFIYADLDMDMTDFTAELSWSLEEIVWFIKQDLILKGKGDFTDASFKATFNMDITINETETIDNVAKSVGVVSTKTILTNHPWVTNVTDEENQLKTESQEMLDKLRQELQVTNEAENGSSVTVGIDDNGGDEE